MAAKLGLDAKLYHNTGTYGVPVWDLIPDARDVTINLERSAAEVSRRGSDWKKFLPALSDATVEFELVYNPTDADFTAIRDAYLNGTILDMAIADGWIATTGTQYLRSEMYVTSFVRGEPLEDMLTLSVTVKPAESTNDPTWTTV